jgi:PTH1 family peptidyl-tRNA hydrolase
MLARPHGARFRGAGPLRLARIRVGPVFLTLLKPMTFMNLVGQAVAPFVASRRLRLEQVLVVQDDLDLPAGRLRIRRSGSAGGHRGVQSLIDELKSPDFARLKIGIGRPATGDDPVPHVLGRPGDQDAGDFYAAVERAAQACLIWAEEGIEAAMNVFNTDAGASPAPPRQGSGA